MSRGRFSQEEKEEFAVMLAERRGSAAECLRLVAPDKTAEMTDDAVYQAASRLQRDAGVIEHRDDRERLFSDMATPALTQWLEWAQRKMDAVGVDSAKDSADFLEKVREFSAKHAGECDIAAEMFAGLTAEEMARTAGALLLCGAELSAEGKQGGMTVRDMIQLGERLHALGVPGQKATKIQVALVGMDGNKFGRRAAQLPDKDAFRFVKLPNGKEVFAHWESLLLGQRIAQEQLSQNNANCRWKGGGGACYFEKNCMNAGLASGAQGE